MVRRLEQRVFGATNTLQESKVVVRSSVPDGEKEALQFELIVLAGSGSRCITICRRQNR